MADAQGIYVSPYTYCMRCGQQSRLTDCIWQAGLLVCKKNNCVDENVIGTRDSLVAKALQQTTKEGEPDEKLTNPAIGGGFTDEIVV